MHDHAPSAIRSLFSWSTERTVHPVMIIGSGLGIGIPMIISGWLGMIGVGGVVSIGSLAIANLSDESPSGNNTQHYYMLWWLMRSHSCLVHW